LDRVHNPSILLVARYFNYKASKLLLQFNTNKHTEKKSKLRSKMKISLGVAR
jgi:hypothetical protein